MFLQGISKNLNLDGIVLYKHCMMQAANRRTNVVQIISKQMTVVHDQFQKGEGKYITHNTHST